MKHFYKGSFLQIVLLVSVMVYVIVGTEGTVAHTAPLVTELSEEAVATVSLQGTPAEGSCAFELSAKEGSYAKLVTDLRVTRTGKGDTYAKIQIRKIAIPSGNAGGGRESIQFWTVYSKDSAIPVVELNRGAFAWHQIPIDDAVTYALSVLRDKKAMMHMRTFEGSEVLLTHKVSTDKDARTLFAACLLRIDVY